MPRRSRSRTRSTSSDSTDDERRHRSRHKAKKKKHDRRGRDDRRRRDHRRATSPADSVSSAEARRLVKAAKRFLKDHLKKQSQGQRALEGDLLPPSAPDPPALTASDYFARNAEFSAWLAEARGAAFADLGPGEGKSLFEAPFLAAWNGRALPARFYSMADAGGAGPGPVRRTAHDWGLAKTSAGPALASAAEEAAAWAAAREERAGAAKAAGAAARAAARDRLNEVAPRPDPGSHEARQAARAGRAVAAAEREASPDAALPGGGRGASVMGGGDSFEAARAREAAAHAWRDRRAAERGAALSAKAAAAKEAEDAKMAAFRALVASGPITIPKRAPPPP